MVGVLRDGSTYINIFFVVQAGGSCFDHLEAIPGCNLGGAVLIKVCPRDKVVLEGGKGRQDGAPNKGCILPLSRGLHTHLLGDHQVLKLLVEAFREAREERPATCNDYVAAKKARDILIALPDGFGGQLVDAPVRGGGGVRG